MASFTVLIILRYYFIHLAKKYGNVTVKDIHKYEKLEYKKNKLKLVIDFLNNCKELGLYPKFLFFKLSNVSNKDASSIRKRLFRSAINKRIKELQYVLEELSEPESFFSKQLSTIDFYIFQKICNIAQQSIATEIAIYSTEKNIFIEEGLQLTYIHT